MKKLFALILALTMALSLAACGSSSSAPAAGSAAASAAGSAAASTGAATKLTLILRGGTYADVIKAALPEFEKENNVTCEVLDLSFDDLHSKIALDAVNEKGAYDLCMVDGSWMAEFTANNVLANLTELGYKLDDDIIPATTTICKVGDNVYLAPYFGNVTVMMYNKKLIEAAGYKAEDIKTFDDLMTIAKSANAAGKKGFLIRGGSPDNIVSDFIPHLLAQGGWVVDSNNKPTVNTPEFKAAMEEYLALYKLGGTMDKDDIVAAVDNGDAALAQGWPGWYVPKADSNASYTVIPTQLTSSSKAYNTSMYGVWTVGICNNSQNKEMAEKLLEYIMSPDVQLASIENGGVPCRFSCLQNKDVLAKYPHLAIVCTALQSGTYRPVIEQWNDFTTILGTEMDNIIQGTKTIDAGLADAQSQLETLMG
jgi:multiple sugar transport system substrate-binding protein